jgi:hypothetical protein
MAEPTEGMTLWVICMRDGAETYASAPYTSLIDAMEASELCEGSWLEPLEVSAS